MKNKFIILLAIFLLASGAAAGYLFGTGKKSASGPESASSSAPLHQSTETHKESTQHTHALTYTASGDLLLGTHGGIFKSTDKGKTLQKVEVKGAVNADDWMGLITDPRDRNIIFAGGHDLGVIKSSDSGTTWVRADSGIMGTDIHGLAINQRNPDLLFAYSVGNGVFRSQDNGMTWKRMDDGPDNPGVRSLTYMAVQTGMDKSMGWDNWGILLAGTADGLFQSFSCFCGWTKTTNIFDNTTVYSLATLHSDLNTMYASTKDGAWKTVDEGKTWNELTGLRGIKIAAIAINPENSKELTAATEDGIIYTSGDVGTTWQKTSSL